MSETPFGPNSVSYTHGETAQRPWGMWEVLAVGAGYCIKRVCVQPGHRLSLQYHHHRAEHWLIVHGNGTVEIEGIVHEAKVHDHFFIEKLQHHRIHNTGTEPLIFVETQCGTQLDEADIVRLQDDYAGA